MIRHGHKNVVYFTGIEVEKSPYYGLKTLFVVGVQPITEILSRALEYNTPAIYLGANQSFAPSNEWRELLLALLEQNINVTLDFDVTHWQWVMDTGAHSFKCFVPMVSVKLPNVAKCNKHTIIKVDDVDFAYSNDGVWCNNISELMHRQKMTHWDEYNNDETKDIQ